MKLSQAQEKTLRKMKPGKWYSAYDLRCRMDTLAALKGKGYVQSKGVDQPGAFSMERTAIEFVRIK